MIDTLKDKDYSPQYLEYARLRRFLYVAVSCVLQSRVAALSRQWETRLAAERHQQEMKMGLRSKTPIPRFHTEVTIGDALDRPPAMNPRHRRSRSVGGDHGVWLEHKENRPAPLGTIFSPTGVNVRKSVTQIELDDTLQATNYVLHHQTATPEGNVETKLFKVLLLDIGESSAELMSIAFTW